MMWDDICNSRKKIKNVDYFKNFNNKKKIEFTMLQAKYLQKREPGLPISIEKGIPHQPLLEKCKIKQQWNIILYWDCQKIFFLN